MERIANHLSQIIANHTNHCKSLKSGIEETFERKEEGENDQLEQLSNASIGLGHDCSEDEDFDYEEHCKTLGGVPINSDERQPQNKHQLVHSTGSKMSREQMEEMLSNRRYKKLTKKLPKAPQRMK